MEASSLQNTQDGRGTGEANNVPPDCHMVKMVLQCDVEDVTPTLLLHLTILKICQSDNGFMLLYFYHRVFHLYSLP